MDPISGEKDRHWLSVLHWFIAPPNCTALGEEAEQAMSFVHLSTMA